MTESLPTSCDVVVIGAGLSGLAAARQLAISGRNVHVVDSADDVGGRVRTDNVDGLLFDRGFQLYNPAYEEGVRILDLQALDIRSFVPGVMVSIDGRSFHLADPRHVPAWAVDSMLAPVGSIASKVKFAQYAARTGLKKRSLDVVDQRTGAFLERKFGKELTNKLLRPFLAGVFLEDNLDTSKRFFDVVLESFIKGTPGVPAHGMQQIPLQLAKQMPAGSIHLNTTVNSIERGKVHTNHGTISTRSIVLATNARGASALVPSISAPPSLGCTTWYHVAECSAQDLTAGQSIVVVDAKRYSAAGVDQSRPLVNSAVLTHAAPGYASNGRILVSSTALGAHDSAQSEARVRNHLASLYGVPTASWTHAATYVVPDALPAMLPPHKPRTDVRMGEGLYLAGDYIEWSSINGAFVSGRRAATALLEDDL